MAWGCCLFYCQGFVRTRLTKISFQHHAFLFLITAIEVLGGNVDVMAKIALISCGRAKAEVKYPNTIKAESLYISPLFKKALKYAKEKINADRLFP